MLDPPRKVRLNENPSMLGLRPMPKAVLPLLACAVVVLMGCHRPDGGEFEVVRLPESAYLAHDAAPGVDAGAVEGGSGRGTGARKPVMPANCVKPPAKTPSDDEASSDFPECMQSKNDRMYLDPEKTKRVREKMGDEGVCCYSTPSYGGE